MGRLIPQKAIIWYRALRALFVQLTGDLEDIGALCRAVIYDPESKTLSALSDMADTWLAMSEEKRAVWLDDALASGKRLLLYDMEDDRPCEITCGENGLPQMTDPMELQKPEAPKKPGIFSRMLDGEAADRYELNMEEYQKELDFSEAAAAYGERRRRMYEDDRIYKREVYDKLAAGRAIQATRDRCSQEIDEAWETLTRGRKRYMELFAPESVKNGENESAMPVHRAAAAAMGISLAEKGMVLIGYLTGESVDEEEQKDIADSAARAREEMEEALLRLYAGEPERSIALIRNAIKVGVGMWQSVRGFNQCTALTIGMFLSDLLECVDENPEIGRCDLLERIDMVEAKSAACVAKVYATFVGACEELLEAKHDPGTAGHRLLALRAVTCAAAIIDLNGANRAAFQIFDPAAMEMITGKRRLFAKGLEAVVAQYYPTALRTVVLEELSDAGRDTIADKIMEIKELKPVLLRQREDIPVNAPVTPEEFHRAIIRPRSAERTL